MAGLSLALLQVCKKFEVTELNAHQREDATNFALKKSSLFVNFENWIWKMLDTSSLIAIEF